MVSSSFPTFININTTKKAVPALFPRISRFYLLLKRCFLSCCIKIIRLTYSVDILAFGVASSDASYTCKMQTIVTLKKSGYNVFDNEMRNCRAGVIERDETLLTPTKIDLS